MNLMNLRGLDGDTDTKQNNIIAHGVKQSTGTEAAASRKPLDGWSQFVAFISTRFNLRQKDLSSAKAIQAADRFSDLLLDFSFPFTQNFSHLLQSFRAGLPRLSTVAPIQAYAEILKVFTEVRTFMDKSGYFDRLRTTKLKSGGYVNYRVLEILQLLFDWVKAVIDDAALLFDQNALLAAINDCAQSNAEIMMAADIATANGLPSPYCGFNQTFIFISCVEVISLLDRRSYLQSLTLQLAKLGNPANYTPKSLLCDLLAPMETGDSTGRLASMNLLFRGLHRLVYECLVAGIMSESDRVVRYLGICPYTSLSRVHFRFLQRAFVADCQTFDTRLDDAGDLELYDRVARLLIKNRDRIGLDVSKIDSHGRSALLTLCSLRCWKAAEQLLESTLTDPLNESLGLAIFPVCRREVSKVDILDFYDASDAVPKHSTFETAVVAKNIGGIMNLSPLHFAVIYGCVEFVRFYLNACPNLTIDASLVHFSVAAGTASSVGILLIARCNSVNADVPACLAFPSPSSTAYSTLSKEIVKGLPCSSRARYRSARDAAVSQLLGVLNDMFETFNIERILNAEIKISVERRVSLPLREQILLNECDWERHQSSSSNIFSSGKLVPLLRGTLQGLCIQPGNSQPGKSRSSSLSCTTVEEGPLISLLDGSSVHFSTFISDINFLLRAVPIPMFSCGTVGSSATVLHSIVTHTESRKELLESMLDAGANRVLCSNRLGETPVFNALTAGNFSEALKLLRHVSDSIVKTSSSALLNCLDARYFRSLVIPQTALTIYPYIYRVFTEHARKNIVLADKELASKKRELFASSPFEANIGLLMEIQGRTERLWKYICGCDFKALLETSYQPPGSVLSSIICAKQVMGLIGIPYSQLGTGGPGLSVTDSMETANVKFRQFQCMSPTNMRQGISMSTGQELKAVLLSWFRQYFDRDDSIGRNSEEVRDRCRAHPDIEASILMFQRLDLSVKDIAENGLPVLKRKIFLASPPGDPHRSASTSRGYLYMNNCNEHLREIGINLGRKFVKQRILSPPRPHADLNTKGLNRVHMQFLVLPSQLQAEVRTVYNSVKDGPGTGLISNEESLTDNYFAKELTSFLDGWAENGERIMTSLRLSYYILDLGRLVVSTRFLVSMTQGTFESSCSGVKPSQADEWSTESLARSRLTRAPSWMSPPLLMEQVAHPLEAAIAARVNAVEQYSRVCSLLGNEGDISRSECDIYESTGASCEMGRGIESRVQILDELNAAGMEHMLGATKEICGPSMSSLRSLVIEALSTLLLVLNRPQFCEVVCRVSRKYNAQVQSGPQYRFPAKPARRPVRSESLFADEAVMNAFEAQKYGDSDDKRAFTDLVICLQHISVGDLLLLCPSLRPSLRQSPDASDHCSDLEKTCKSISTVTEMMVADLSRRNPGSSIHPSFVNSSAFAKCLIDDRVLEIERYAQSSPEFLTANIDLERAPQQLGHDTGLTPQKKTRIYLSAAK
jgi:hypothetical protein